MFIKSNLKREYRFSVLVVFKNSNFVKLFFFWFVGSIFWVGCLNAESVYARVNEIEPPSHANRIRYPQHSFPDFVQNLPLKSEKVLWTHDQKNIIGRYDTIAVVDLPLLFKDDLEQCADYSMRVWAEYHKQNGSLNRFYLFDYNGNRKQFRGSGLSYVAFLRKVFVSSNSYSLKRGGAAIQETDLRPGDLFVQNENGGIGHVSMILDTAVGKEGKKFYLIGFSFMPAQEMHIEKAPNQFGAKGWFTYNGFISYLKESYPYGTPMLRRFSESKK